RPPVGESDKIEVAERDRQTRMLGSPSGDERRPQELRLRGLGKGSKGWLEHHGLLTWNGEKCRHKGFAAGDRQGREVNLWNSRDVEEILGLCDGELGAPRQKVD